MPPTGSRCDHAHFRYDVANEFLFEVDFASNPQSWKVEIFGERAARLPAHWARTSGLSWQRFRSYGGWNFRSKNFQHHLQTAFMTTWGYNFLRPYSTWKRSLIRILNEIGIQENVPGEFEVPMYFKWEKNFFAQKSPKTCFLHVSEVSDHFQNFSFFPLKLTRGT